MYLSIKGKAKRKEFIICTFLNIAITALITQFSQRFYFSDKFWIAVLFLLIPNFLFAFLETPVTIRRLNDLNIVWNRIFLFFMPLYNIIFLFQLALSPSVENPHSFSEEGSEEEENVETCPNCKSDDITHDKTNELMQRILLKVLMQKRHTILDYRCFECGHKWSI